MSLITLLFQVYDVRTFSLQRQIPEMFNHVVKSSSDKRVLITHHKHHSFLTEQSHKIQFIDSRDYSILTVIDTEGSVQSLTPAWDDSSLAVCEEDRMKPIGIKLYSF